MASGVFYIRAFCLMTFVSFVSAQVHRRRCPGWFGSRCQYKCHCKHERSCDKTIGCPQSLCDKGWFGPACQYEDLATRSDWSHQFDWLEDNNDKTCNMDPLLDEVTLHLKYPLPFTWLRLVVNDPETLTSLQVQFLESSDSTSRLPCFNEEKTQFLNSTVDIHCRLETLVEKIIISGKGVGSLCSVYVSGGRNVALKQTASQSSEYKSNLQPAENAVDGGDSFTFWGKSCTHTSVDDPHPSWTVTFTQPMMINRYDLYNRHDRRDPPWVPKRLSSFQLVARSDRDKAIFSYREPGRKQELYILPVADMSQTSPISSVTVTATHMGLDDLVILTICEAEFYGDTVCEDGRYGRECEHQCYCLDGHPCFVSTGRCPNGCTPGYRGETCSQKCPNGSYGQDCKSTCSLYCRPIVNNSTRSQCHHITGKCHEGCQAGYTGDLCQAECPDGSYGQDCKSTCSLYCRPIVNKSTQSQCHHITGKCHEGCKAGFIGDLCQTECPDGSYGQDCKSTCSLYCRPIVNNSTRSQCHHITGKCHEGCQAGYTGDLCQAEKDSGGDVPKVAILAPIAVLVTLASLGVLGVVVRRIITKPERPEPILDMRNF